MIWFRALLLAILGGVGVLAVSQVAAKPTPPGAPTAAPTEAATEAPTPRPTRVPLPTLPPEAIVSRISRATPAPPAPPPTYSPTAPHVEVIDYGFSPGQVTVQLGATITFTNEGSDGHDVTGTGTGGVWRSGPLAPSEHYAHTFGLPGTYDYVCSIHPEMQGRVVVQP